MEFDSKSWAITGVAAVVIIGLVWWGVASRHSTVVGSDGATTTITVESDGSSTETAVAGMSGSQAPVVQTEAPKGVTEVASGETVTTQDQAAGETVAISQASLKSPSWIAIKDTSGRILGAGWFAESGENLSVPLLRATTAGDVYQAVIYVDSGDKKFDFHTDTLLTSSEGAPVSSTFRAQ